VKADAARVVLQLRGGAGYGGPDLQKMISIHVDVHNDAKHGITVHQIALAPPLQPKRLPSFPLRISAGESWSAQVEIAAIDARAGELSGRPLERYTASLTYSLDGREWMRGIGEPPSRA
jgi:hypothetical protein